MLDEVVQLQMINEQMQAPAQFDLPEGYAYRLFDRKTGREDWCQVTVKTDLFNNIDEAYKTFDTEFAPYLDEMEKRSIFLIDTKKDVIIGTITSWYNKINDRDFGMMHWVGIDEEYQGRGLGKSMINYGVMHLTTMHDIGMLGTQGFRLAAIKRYLTCGFVPWIKKQEDIGEWDRVAEAIDHPSLKARVVDIDK